VFIETVLIIAEVYDIDADDLLIKIMTNPQAERLLNMFMENRLKETG
jgi:hypothetical protein